MDERELIVASAADLDARILMVGFDYCSGVLRRQIGTGGVGIGTYDSLVATSATLRI
jgi:hypothetical protein